MDQSAAIYLNQNNKLQYFKKILLACLVLIVVLVSIFAVFQEKILSALEPLLPMDAGKSPQYYRDFYMLGVFELIWAGMVIFIALVLYSFPSLTYNFQRIEDFMIRQPEKYSRIVILFFAAITLLVAFAILKDFPNSSDEYVYLYQAKSMSEGRLQEDAHPVEKSFGFNHIAVKDGKSVGRFPPGWPSILALLYFLHIPPVLANPILAVLTLFFFYKLARKLYGDRIAGWSLLLLAFSSFFIFNSASYFSHPTCLFASVLFVYCVYNYFDQNKALYALLAGSCMGFIMLSRYYTALLIFLPFFVILLHWQAKRALLLFIFMALGALPFLGFLLWYNYSLTGDAFVPVTMWAYREEGLGFINGHTPVKGLEHIIRRFLMFIYWFTPVILFLYFFFLWDKLKQKTRFVAPEDYIFLMLVAGYFFYYEIGGNQYGPRFYYEALPFMILFVVAKVILEKKLWAQVLLYAALLISVVRMPFIAHREYRIILERKEVYTLVEKKKISNAVILLSSGTSVTRPMPSGDLTRNDNEYQDDVLYAIDHPEANPALMSYYKERKFYKYIREPGEKRGKLIRLR